MDLSPVPKPTPFLDTVGQGSRKPQALGNRERAGGGVAAQAPAPSCFPPLSASRPHGPC